MRGATHSVPVVKQPQPPADPIPVEILAQSIKDISEGFKRMDASRLSRKALVLLISEHSGVGRNQVTYVLNTLAELERIYLKPKEGK